MLSVNETPVTNTTNTTAFTYVLASNVYSRIIIETECGFSSTANNATVTFNILVGATNKRSRLIRHNSSGSEAGRTLKYSEAITAGGTITVTTTGTNNGTWTIDSLRVYGVI